MSFLQDLDVVYVAILLFGVYFVYCALYPWVFSPLKGYPGPWYAAHTKWWLVYKTQQGVRAKTIHALHEKYGPWVRVAPNELSTCDSQALVPIYGVNSNYVKTEFYTYQLRGIPELFTISDRKAHQTRRRQLSHLFSMSTTLEYEPIIAGHVRECMDQIAAQGMASQPSNLYDWWHYLSMDIVCDLSFGRTFHMLREGAQSHYIKDMYGSLEIEPIRWHFGWLNNFASWAPLKFVRDAEACSIRSMAKGVKMVQEYKQSSEKARRKDLLQKLMDARDDQGRPLGDEALVVEATGFILAGSHTTSSSLTWIVWRLLKNPKILASLRQELDVALKALPYKKVPPHSLLEGLPWLESIIKEGLRIDTAVPGSTPRYVPPEGGQINGHQLPGHTIISAQAYTCHRDPTVFHDPECFMPERWMKGNETQEMRRLYIPFGPDGPRKCIGMHLAYMELRVILASLVHRFDLSFAGDFDDASMEMMELWLANPCGQRLDVIARERTRGAV